MIALPPFRSTRVGIEVEAALAFGTGHHGTTRGCLLALDRLCKSTGMRPRRLLRIWIFGTGSGVLALPLCARLAPARACDRCRSPAAVRAARANARLNRAAADDRGRQRGRRHHARSLPARAPFDLVFANILLLPLQRIATPLQRLTAPGCRIVLSGLAAGAGRRRAGRLSRPFALERRIDLDGWTTLVLARRAGRRGAVARRRPRSNIWLADVRGRVSNRSKNSGDRGASAPHVAGIARRARRGAGSTASWCRAPTASRTNTSPPCAERLAWLTGFTGSAGLAIVLADPRRPLRRRPLSGAGARGSRRRDFLRSSISSSIRRTNMARSHLRAGAQARLFAVAAHHRRRRAALVKACAAAVARAHPVNRTIQSTRSGPIGRRRPAAPWCCTICVTPAKPRGRARARARRDSRRLQPTRSWSAHPHAVSWLFNIRGSDIPHTPIVLAFALVPLARAGRLSIVDRPQTCTDVRHHLEEIADVRRDRGVEHGLAALGSERRKVQLRPLPPPRRR